MQLWSCVHNIFEIVKQNSSILLTRVTPVWENRSAERRYGRRLITSSISSWHKTLEMPDCNYRASIVLLSGRLKTLNCLGHKNHSCFFRGNVTFLGVIKHCLRALFNIFCQIRSGLDLYLLTTMFDKGGSCLGTCMCHLRRPKSLMR